MTPNVYADLDAEKSVIGAMLQDASCLWLLDELTESDFTKPEYRAAFTCAKKLRAASKAVDFVTVASAEREASGVDMSAVLLEAVRYVPTTANVRTYADMVRERTRRRELRDICEQTLGSLGGSNADEAVDTALTALRGVLGGQSTWVSFGEVAARTYDMMEAISRGEIRTIPTGLPDLDNATAGGLRKGEVTVIAAGTGQGKSALALFLAKNAAQKGFCTGVVSREMTVEQYGFRALAAMTGIETGDLMQAKRLYPKQWEAVSKAAADMQRLPIHFTFRASTVEDVRREAQRHGKLDLLIVDYIQILQTREKYASEHLRVSHISRCLKEIALDMEIPVIVLSQLKRQPNGMTRKPILADLKESGSIENDADAVWFLYRPQNDNDSNIPSAYDGWYDAAENLGDRFMLLEVAKQRMYAPGTIGVCFDTRKMRFYNPYTEKP